MCMLLPREWSILPTTASVPVVAPSGLQGGAAKDKWKGTPPPTNDTTARDDSSEDSGSEEEREEEEGPQHVASGWNSVVATTVWLRVLGILGDVSRLPHPLHREEALRHILKTWILLEKVGGREGKRGGREGKRREGRGEEGGKRREGRGGRGGEGGEGGREGGKRRGCFSCYRLLLGPELLFSGSNQWLVALHMEAFLLVSLQQHLAAPTSPRTRTQ